MLYLVSVEPKLIEMIVFTIPLNHQIQEGNNTENYENYKEKNVGAARSQPLHKHVT